MQVFLYLALRICIQQDYYRSNIYEINTNAL